jgi:hypothetical protein
LAPVQAYVLHDLLFSEHKLQQTFPGEPVPLKPTQEQQQAALLRALTAMICKAAASTEQKQFMVVSGSNKLSITVTACPTAEAVTTELARVYTDLQSEIGVLLFVYSMLLTRSIDRVKADMDDSSQPLVARWGHCTQEIVNLALSGCAASNVFDGNKDISGYVMHGVPHAMDVGYVTLLEYLRYATVGSYYKGPKTPIWVVGSSSHYSVMFALDKTVGQVSEAETKKQAAKNAFTELDPHENGFVPLNLLPTLVQKIPALGPVTATELDPDGMGIILWEKVATALAQSSANSNISQASAEAYSCTACTFFNQGSNARCEVCNTPRPPPQPITTNNNSTQEGKTSPSFFQLYHFNGIDGHGKAVATCCQISVTLLGDGVRRQGDTASKRGLREVVQTKWPSSLIEYLHGKEPKII